MNPELEEIRILLDKWFKDRYEAGQFQISMDADQVGKVATDLVMNLIAKGVAMYIYTDLNLTSQFVELHKATANLVRDLETFPGGTNVCYYHYHVLLSSILQHAMEATTMLIEKNR